MGNSNVEEKDIQIKKKELKDKLENELYVDTYSTFKNSISLINEALKSFDINYQYTYDKFCIDFTEECLLYQDEHPNVNMTSSIEIMLYIYPIVISIINKKKKEYGSI